MQRAKVVKKHHGARRFQAIRHSCPLLVIRPHKDLDPTFMEDDYCQGLFIPPKAALDVLQ